jgi:hypothetical protein
MKIELKVELDTEVQDDKEILEQLVELIEQIKYYTQGEEDE